MADAKENAKKLAKKENRKISRMTEKEGPDLVDYTTRGRVGVNTDNLLNQREDLQRQSEKDFEGKKYASGASKKALREMLAVPTAASAGIGSIVNTVTEGRPLRGKKSVYDDAEGMKKGGSVKSSASKRADGCAVRGKTRA